MIKVIPAIIPKNKEQLGEDVDKVSSFANFIQIDISDGIFTPYKTWPYSGVDYDFFDDLRTEKIGLPKWESVDYEVHLMIQNPGYVLEDWIKAGVSSVVVHIETTDDFQKIIDVCKENQVEIWVAIKPSTDISKIAPFVSKVSGVQCMGSDQLGKYGTELENTALEKIKKLHILCPECIIAVDIGVNLENKDDLLEAGASKLICGSAILESENPKEVFEELSS